MTDENTNKPAQNDKPRTTKRPPEYDFYTVKKVNGEDDWKKHCGVWIHANGYLTGRFGEVRVVLKPRKPFQPPQPKNTQGQPSPVSVVPDKPEVLH